MAGIFAGLNPFRGILSGLLSAAGVTPGVETPPTAPRPTPAFRLPGMAPIPEAQPRTGTFARVESDDLPGDARAVERHFPQVQPQVPTPRPDPAAQRFTVHAQPTRPGGRPASGNTYNEFMSAVRAGGLTNPYGLAAVAATGQHESGWNDKNVFGRWSDPSQSGQPGVSGGALSWRAERYRAMQKFVQARGGDSARAQAEFFLQENPGLIQALQNARSPDEAQRLMNNAWRFAGYDKAGGEASRRIQTARARVTEFGGRSDPGVPLTTPLASETPYTGGTGSFAVAEASRFPAAPPTPTQKPQNGAGSGQGASLGMSAEETIPPEQRPSTPVAQAVEQWKVNKTTRRMRGMSRAATIGALTAIGQMEREEAEQAMGLQPRIDTGAR